MSSTPSPQRRPCRAERGKEINRRQAVGGFVLAIATLVAVWVHTGAGQQTVTFQGGIPLAPSGLAGRKLPNLPMEFPTAEGHRIRVVAVTRALEFPWSLTFLPDGTMLVTERADVDSRVAHAAGSSVNGWTA